MTSLFGRGGSVRSKQSVAAETMMRERSAQLADAVVAESQAIKEVRAKRQEEFLSRQQSRIAAFRQQEHHDTPAAIEALQRVKREVGVEMRHELQKAYQRVQRRNQKRADETAALVKDARRGKEAETQARKKLERQRAELIAAQAQVERRRRREESLATVRKQEQAAADFAARVRFETRPDVRHETREFFQAQRDALCASERDQQQANRRRREAQQKQFFERAWETITGVQSEEDASIRARGELVERRRRDADGVRSQLLAERRRKQRIADKLAKSLRERHDAVIDNRFDPTEHEDESGSWWSWGGGAGEGRRRREQQQEGRESKHGRGGADPDGDAHRRRLQAKSRAWAAGQ